MADQKIVGKILNVTGNVKIIDANGEERVAVAGGVIYAGGRIVSTDDDATIEVKYTSLEESTVYEDVFDVLVDSSVFAQSDGDNELNLEDGDIDELETAAGEERAESNSGAIPDTGVSARKTNLQEHEEREQEEVDFSSSDKGEGQGSNAQDQDAPIITSPNVVAFDENSEEVVLTLTANDVNDVTFTIDGGADAAFFIIDSITGELRFINSPDYEDALDSNSTNSYEVNVRVTDSVGNFTIQTISVNINNLNDNNPIIEEPTKDSQTDAIENAKPIAGQLQATDADGNALKFVEVEQVQGKGLKKIPNQFEGKGNFTLNEDGSYEYDAGNDFEYLAAGQETTVTFSYKAVETDSPEAFESPVETITFTITGTNDQPEIDSIVKGTRRIIYETHDSRDIPGKDDTNGETKKDAKQEKDNVIKGKLTASDDDTNDGHIFGLTDMKLDGEMRPPSPRRAESDIERAVAHLDAKPMITQELITTKYDLHGNTGPKVEGKIDVLFDSKAIKAEDISLGKITFTSNGGGDSDAKFAIKGDFSALSAGETATITFKYYADDQSRDKHGETSQSEAKTVSITITGTNDQPVVEDVVLGLGKKDVIYETQDNNDRPVIDEKNAKAIKGNEEELDNVIRGKLTAEDNDTNDGHIFGLTDMKLDGEMKPPSPRRAESDIERAVAHLDAKPMITQELITINYDIHGNEKQDFKELRSEKDALDTIDVLFDSKYINAKDISLDKITFTNNDGADSAIDFALKGDFSALSAGETATITFKYYADDQSRDKHGETSQSEAKTVSITITGTNDAPEVTSTDTSYTEVDGARNWMILEPTASVNDVDKASSFQSVTISTPASNDDGYDSYGALLHLAERNTDAFTDLVSTIKITDQDGKEFTPNEGGHIWWATGTSLTVTKLDGSNLNDAEVEAIMQAVKFSTGDRVPSDAHDIDVTFSVTDDKGVAGTSVTTVAITGTNDTPTFTFINENITEVSVNEDEAVSMSGKVKLGWDDNDDTAGNGTLTLSVAHGTLAIDMGTASTGVNITGNETGTVSITGKIWQLNALINGTSNADISYQGDKDFNGDDNLAVSYSDNGDLGFGDAKSGSINFGIDVLAVNDVSEGYWTKGTDEVVNVTKPVSTWGDSAIKDITETLNIDPTFGRQDTKLSSNIYIDADSNHTASISLDIAMSGYNASDYVKVILYVNNTSPTTQRVFSDGTVTFSGLSQSANYRIALNGHDLSEASDDLKVSVSNIKVTSFELIETTIDIDARGADADWVEATTATGNVLENDDFTILSVDAQAMTNAGLSISGVNGVLAIQANGSYIYTPNDGDISSEDLATADEFTYTIKDSEGLESSSTLTIDVADYDYSASPSIVENGTSADDVIYGDTSALNTIDAGDGVDTLVLAGVQTFDLSNVSNIETIQLDTTVDLGTITADDVISMTDSDNILMITSPEGVASNQVTVDDSLTLDNVNTTEGYDTYTDGQGTMLLIEITTPVDVD